MTPEASHFEFCDSEWDWKPGKGVGVNMDMKSDRGDKWSPDKVGPKDFLLSVDSLC